MICLQFGRWQDAASELKFADCLISDPPYSEKTHVGRRTGSEIRQSGIKYNSLTRDEAFEIAKFWSPKVRFWTVLFCDHIARQWHQEAWEAAGWYTFGPVRWVKSNGTPRMSGDGPTVSTEDIFVARRKSQLPQERRGSRPGHYIYGTETGGDPNRVTGKSFPGKKPAELMKALILDYTLPGDVVVDPYVGSGTTLIVADSHRRNAYGFEADPENCAEANRNINAGFTQEMFVA